MLAIWNERRKKSSFCSPEQVIGADADHEESSRGETRQDGVGKLGPDIWVGDHRPKIGHHCPPILDGIPNGLLHERIGDQDPQGRDVRAKSHQPDGSGMQPLRELIPTEHPEPQEDRFQEESQQGFDRQWSAEDIAHETGVIGPVHAELELHARCR